MNDRETTLLAAAITTTGPTIAVMIGIFFNSRKIDSLRRQMQSQIGGRGGEIGTLRRDMASRFDSLEKVFTERLLRFEQTIDVRLKRLEEREH